MSSSVKRQFDPPSSASSNSSIADDSDVADNIDMLEHCMDMKFDDCASEECSLYSNDAYCPASPTTIPSFRTKSGSGAGAAGQAGGPGGASSLRSPRPRRQRTTSINQTTTINATESIIRHNNRTIYTAGRPPWYNCAGQQVEPFVIGICGGSASGKTTVAQKIIESLDVPWVTLLSMDCFYKILNHDEHERAGRNEYNFDHPDAFDIDLMVDVLRKLKEV